MGLLGAVRTRSDQADKPLYRCDELWISPEFIDRCPGWSWKLDMPDPLTDDTPWRLGLAVFVGHCITFDTAEIHAVWRIVEADNGAGLLLCRWPD